MTHNTYTKTFAALFAAIMVVSMLAPTAGAAVASNSADITTDFDDVDALDDDVDAFDAEADSTNNTVEASDQDVSLDDVDRQATSGVDIDGELANEFRTADDTVEVVVRLGAADLDDVTGQQATIDTLQVHADATQVDTIRFAESMDGVEMLNRFYISNAVLLEVDPDEVALDRVAAVDGVERLHANFEMTTMDEEGISADDADGDDADPDAEPHEEYDVAVVGSTAQPDSTYGMDYIEIVLDERLSDDYTVEAIHPDPDEDHPQEEDILELMDQYDAFVVNTMGGLDSDEILDDFLDQLEDDQAAIYLDQFQNADAIEDLSDVRDDPEEVSEDFGDDPSVEYMELEATAEHPIYTGLADDPGDRIPLFDVDDDGFLDYVTFDGYDGDGIGDIAPDNDEPFGHAAAVDDDRDESLLVLGHGSLVNWNDEGPYTYTSDAENLLTNAVEYHTTGEVTPPGEDPIDYDVTYGLEQANVPDVWDNLGVTGDGAGVAILDTGVDNDHPDFDMDPDNFQEWDGDGNPVESEPNDGNGHGTHVSGTAVGPQDPDGDVPAYGVAPDAELYHGKVLDDGGGGTFAQINAGMEWAAEQEEVDVVGMSLGADGYLPDMIEPAENIRNAEKILSVSIGNTGQGASGSPGNYYSTFGSGAVDENGELAGFSGGEEIDTESAWGDDAPDYWPDEYIQPNAAAAGVNVLSAYVGTEYDELSGTSMSQPHKAGTFALMASATEQTDVELFENIVEETAEQPDHAPEDDPNTEFGHGIIDAHGAVQQVALDSGVEGIVTDSDGEPIEGATVTIEETGFDATTDEDGHYELIAEPGEYTLTATGFGYEETDATVEIPDEETFVEQDFELGDALGVELLEDQSPLVQTGDDIEVSVNVANLETLTIEQTGEYDGELTLFVAGTEYEFGEPIELGGFSGEADVVVETEEGVEGEVELHHTFEGLGDTVEVTTGPTEVTDLDSIVYAGSDDNSLYAFEAATGDEQWSHDMGNDVRAAPIASNGYVYAATFDGNLEKLDGASGEVEWVFDEPASIFSDPVVSEELGMVWVGTNDARLFGVDLETGEAEWELDTDLMVGAAPNVVGETLYVGGNSGSFWAIDAMTGDVIWENIEGQDYIGAATWVDGGVVTADRGASAVRLHDAETGDIVWENTEPSGDIWSPAVSPAEGMVYAGDDGALHAFDLDTGDIEFSIETNDRMVAAPTVHDGNVIFADEAAGGGTIWSADAHTGEVEWEVDADEAVAGSPTVADGVVYVGAGSGRLGPDPDDGYVYALDVESGDEIWTVENPGDGHGFFGDPTYVEDGMSQGTATLLGTNGHNDLFPVPDLDQGIEGTVTDTAGEPVADATVDPEESPSSTFTDENGNYEAPLEPGTYTVDVSAFGFETATESVDVEEGEFTEQDFELVETLDIELLQDQPEELDSGNDIEVLVNAANVDTLTIEQTGEYDGDLTLFVAGTEYEFGEEIDLDGFTGEADVVVETEDGDSGMVELHHTFEGLGDTIEVTTGPTEVFEEIRFIGVVEDSDPSIGEDFVDILDEELSDVYEIDHVTSDEALDELDTYDGFFVHALDNEDEWFDATDDVGTVYTSQNIGPTTLDDRADVIDDPDTVTQDIDLATWTVTEEHELFDGVADPGDDVLVHTESFGDGASFDGTDAEVIADQADGDHGVAVDDDRQDVLLTAVGIDWVLPFHHTDEAVEVLGNSVTHFADEDGEATIEVADVDPSGDFEVDPGEELEIDATIENTGDEAGTAAVDFVFDGDTIATEEVELEPGEQGTVTFDVTAPDAEGEYDWYIATQDDQSEVWTLTVVDDAPPADDTVSFGDGEFVFAPGQTDTVTMNTSADDVAGFEVFVDFDPEYVHVEKIEKADLDGTLVTDIDNENGTFAAALAQANGEDAPDMLDVEITFTGEYGDMTDLTFDADSALFASDGEIDADFEDATLTAGQLGDVNNDGKINAYDAILIQQYIAGQEPTDDFYPALADVTQDGEIHTGDVIAVLDMIVDGEVDGDSIEAQQDATSIDADGVAVAAV